MGHSNRRLINETVVCVARMKARSSTMFAALIKKNKTFAETDSVSIMQNLDQTVRPFEPFQVLRTYRYSCTRRLLHFQDKITVCTQMQNSILLSTSRITIESQMFEWQLEYCDSGEY